MIQDQPKPTPVGSEKPLVCEKCQASNAANSRFCGSCGQRLWEPCGKCKAPNATSREFCCECGANTREIYHERLQALRGKLARAKTFRSTGRYMDAMTELRSIVTGEDSRLTSLLQHVPELLEEISKERESSLGNMLAAMESAKADIDQLDFIKARETLNAVPPGVRDRECTRMLDCCNEALAQIEQLTRRIKESVKTKQYSGLLPFVHQLLQLKPNDPQLLTLVEQLQAHEQKQANNATDLALKQATKQFKASQYISARKLLDDIDETCLTKTTQPIYDTIAEVSWCVGLVRDDPFVTRHLLTAVKRWKKYRPDDASVEKILPTIKKRIAMAEKDKARVFATPRKPDQVPQLMDLPVRWWRGLQKADFADSGCDDFAECPSRFHVAYGLAIQGLGNALLKHNLLPQKKNFLSKISGLRAKPMMVWGIDVGVSGIKAVQLERVKSSDIPRMQAARFVPHDLSHTQDEQTRSERLASSIAKLIDEHEISNAAAVVGLSGPRSLGKTFTIPKLPGKKSEDAIAYETRIQIPLSSSEIYYDWHTWPAEKDASENLVTLLAAKRDHVNQWLEAFDETAIQPVAIQSVCLALYNAALTEFFPLQDAGSDAVAVLEIGSESSTLVIVSQEFVRYRSIPTGTHRIDRHLLTQQTSVRADQVQRLRCQPDAMPKLYRLDEATTVVVQDLVKDVQRTLSAYRTEGINIKELLVTGGATEQIGLLRALVAMSD